MLFVAVSTPKNVLPPPRPLLPPQVRPTPPARRVRFRPAASAESRERRPVLRASWVSLERWLRAYRSGRALRAPGPAVPPVGFGPFSDGPAEPRRQDHTPAVLDGR